MCLVAGFRVQSWALFPVALVFMFLTAVFFAALGTAIGSLLEDMQAFPLIMNFLVMPLFFFSGSLFPVKDLPVALAIVVRLNPLTYAVDGLRGALGNQATFGIGLDLLMLWCCAGALLSLERVNFLEDSNLRSCV